jgi:adenylosuccinate synthase
MRRPDRASGHRCCTTCWASPRPTPRAWAAARSRPSCRWTEPGSVGHHLSSVGQERGTVTGRARRCGWLDAAALKRSAIINGLSGLCITKLDVLDGLAEIKVCVGYVLDGTQPGHPAAGRRRDRRLRAVYESFAGWNQTTAGLTELGPAAANARRYLERVQSLIGTPIDMVSTGPDRDHTILLRHPYRS